MKFGFACSIEKNALLQEVGYDYQEITLGSLYKYTKEEFNQVKASVKGGLPIEAANLFYLPGYVIVGPETTPREDLVEYTKTVFERAAELGIQTCVLGSSKARSIPEGFSQERAEEQLLSTLYLTGDLAKENGLRVVVEPINAKENNYILTVADGLRIVHKVGHSHILLLADLYHMGQMQEDFSAIYSAGPLLQHVHIAEPITREIPSVDDSYNYEPFAEALRDIGYVGRMTIEARTHEATYMEGLKQGLQALKKNF